MQCNCIAVIGTAVFLLLTDRLIVYSEITKIIDKVKCTVIFRKDKAGIYRYVNYDFLVYFNLTEQQVLGKSDSDIFNKNLSDKLNYLHQLLLHNRPAKLFPLVINHKNQMITALITSYVDQHDLVYVLLILNESDERECNKELVYSEYHGGINIKLGSKYIKLSRREHEVLKATLQAKSASMIAEDLCRSVKTIDCHLTNIRKKFNCCNKKHLIRLLAETGLQPLICKIHS